MGNYINIQLKKTNNVHVAKVNKQLDKLGIKIKKFNGVPYGAFVTYDLLKEEVRMLNTDPQSMQYMPHLQRPVKPEDLETSAPWYRRGFFQVKLSCATDEELIPALIMALFIEDNPELIDFNKSGSYTVEEVYNYFEDNYLATTVIENYQVQTGQFSGTQKECELVKDRMKRALSPKKLYNIAWEINIEATSPLEAAQEALKQIQAQDTIETLFYVQDDDTKNIVSVDLEESDEDAVLPVQDYLPIIQRKK